MKKLSTLLLFICLTVAINAQNQKQAEKALKKVSKLKHITALKVKYPDWDISTDVTLYSDTARFEKITSAQNGDLLYKKFYNTGPTYLLKVIKTEELELCKVKYIYLYGKELSKTTIDSLRAVIIERYQQGESFEALVKEYTMDGNPTGELIWFYKGMMVEAFDDAVRPRAKGEIFTVDVESNQWYYVVLKTHDNKMEKAVRGIKIKLKE